MKRAVARMVLVTLVTLTLYGLALIILAAIPGLDLVQPLPIPWTGMFAVAVAFAAWNAWDDLLDARAVIKRARLEGRAVPVRTLAGGIWRLRSDSLQGTCCAAMAGAGALAIVALGPPEIRTAIISVGALALVANQVWNRLDRERVIRMPDAWYGRRLEGLAIELAHDARQMGHDVQGALQAPVGTPELLRARPDLTSDERENIDRALDVLLGLAERVRRLHEHARRSDPSLRSDDAP